MIRIQTPPEHRLKEGSVTPEKIFLRRREFIRDLGFLGSTALLSQIAAPAALSQAVAGKDSTAGAPTATRKSPYPAKQNPAYSPKLPLSKESVVTTYNNFYEFSTDKELVHQLTGRFTIKPWAVAINGLVEKPMTLDAWELADMFDLEERIYRFRCVEAWSMVVPWTGFPLAKLIAKVQPKAEAKFIKFTTFMRPNEAPGFRQLPNYPWPYTEGLRMDEAMNDLTLVATGIYGKPLPKQQGAPLRIVVPWKYGYKSIKSVVRMEFVATQPKTLWETLAPDEYPFESNVNPKVPHPRWSQATERVIDTGDRIATLPYNGYATQVAQLYKRV